MEADLRAPWDRVIVQSCSWFNKFPQLSTPLIHLPSNWISLVWYFALFLTTDYTPNRSSGVVKFWGWVENVEFYGDAAPNCVIRHHIRYKQMDVFASASFFYLMTAEQYCTNRRIKCTGWKIITPFIVWQHQLCSVPPPRTHPPALRALRAISEGQSEIEKSIWRQLAWLHSQAALMTADSPLQLLVQSYSNSFLCGAVSNRSVLFRRACSIKCASSLSVCSAIPS